MPANVGQPGAGQPGGTQPGGRHPGGGRPLSKWRLLARAAGIGARVGKHWTRFWLGWVLLWVRRAGRARRRAWLGRVVVDLFRELGATFIKVGQIMSTRPDLIPEYLSSALSELQDHVGPFPFEEVVRT